MTPVPRGFVRSLIAAALLAAGLMLAAPSSADTLLCDGLVPTHIVDVPAGTRFDGSAGDDVILGTAGDDLIYGLAGNDVICGGAGNDRLFGGRGADRLFGEAGDDLLLGGPGNDVLFGGDGADEVSGDAGRDAVYGDEGSDVLYGGNGADTLRGGGGDDKAFGEAGRDRLFGGDGVDELQGGTEADRLLGEGGGDFLWGDAGDDLLNGGPGDDLLQGGPGADDLRGGSGFDEMWGGECRLTVAQDGAVKCRLVPSGRPEGDPTVDPGDLYSGGPGLDACDKSPTVPAGCDTYRGERGGPRYIKTSEEWWEAIENAFSERALLLLNEDKRDVADALLAEVTHAKQIAACESLGDVFQETRAQGTVAYGQTTWVGLFQHDPGPWSWRARDAGWPGASIYDPVANARIAAWMVAEDIERYWDEPNRIEDRLAWARWSCDHYIDEHWNLWDTP